MGTTKLPNFSNSPTTNLVKFFAKINWPYNLKEPSEKLIKVMVMKKSDGNHPLWKAVPCPVSKIE